MSIKDLFGKTSRNLEDTVQDVESTNFVEEKNKKQDRYLPPVDFSDPKNFAFYGSAELYYDAAIRRIYEDYPYDGSKSEQIKFEEQASHLERWLFENKYPKTTGYIEHGISGDLTPVPNSFATTTTPEYIRVWGGLHTDNSNSLEDKFKKSAKYDIDKNRNQNWNCNFEQGVTIEFFFKKDSFASGSREVILDLWNGKTSVTEKGRLLIYISNVGGTTSMNLHLQSFGTFTIDLLPGTSLDFSSWKHYAISLKQVGSNLEIKFYINGDEIAFQYAAGTFQEMSGKVDGYIGALQTDFLNGAVTSTATDGKLQGNLDEFRFWKTCRTSRQIKLNWFSQVGGGANTDDSTSNLGVYFKFNEGILGNPTTDSVVLDYSGRLANGQWIGYPGISARSTGSAIEELGYSEVKTPIIYSDHSDVLALISEMSTSGSIYDAERGESFYSSMPNWMLTEDNGNFKIISHILASYLDTLHVQISNITEIKNKQYNPESYKANTLASELLKEKGFLTPNLFETTEIHEKLSELNLDNVQFQTDLSEIKNIIYTNIYNNLEKIYKSKGTEASIRNLIRCFGVDDELIKLNLYTDGGLLYFTDKSRETSVKKKYINFNNPDYFSSTIYQTSSLGNANTFIYGSHSSIDGSKNAFTLEADIIVPYKKNFEDNGYFATPFLSASVFGFHEANDGDVTDFTWWNAPLTEARDLQVYIVKDSLNSQNAKFVLKNETETIYQESDWIYDIYDNEHYNVAIRIKPQTYPYAGGVTNTEPDYDIEMYAVTNNFGEIKEEILLSQVVDFDTGSQYIRAPKRVYAGAHIVNFTGSVDKQTDIEIGSIRAWFDYLSDAEIFEHNKDVLNYGSSKSIDGSNLYTIDDVQIPTQELTILNWDFDTVSSSDVSGQFDVEDLTSGSSDTIYGWVDQIIRREHKGIGAFFPSEDSSFLSNEFLFAKRKQLPETSYDSDNIFIKGEEEINFAVDDDVSDNLFILEKSPSSLVSEEMLKSFSTTMEFANLFARPIERFRINYKDLARARELFFQRVESNLDFDRFFEYFKWIDSSISSMINQLVPLSTNFVGGITDVVESHILERDKYQRQVGLLNTITSTEASIRGRQELGYNWRIGHAPVPVAGIVGEENAFWQRERRERPEVEREEIRKVAIRQTNQEYENPINLSSSAGVISGNTYATRRLSRTYDVGIDFRNSIHGGINYNKGKNRDFMSTVIAPQGEIAGSGAPKNIMTIGAGDGHGLTPTSSYLDVGPNDLIKRDGYAQVGIYSSFSNYESLGNDYDYLYRQKISDVFIGNIVSSSVNTGYASLINKSGVANGYKEGVNIVNLHSDTTDITNEIPVQGPFTQQWVGGHQSRHVSIASGPATLETRPEAWRLLVGTNPLTDPTDTDGAIGFTGPDYGAPYPVSENQKAIYYREERAKRPVSVKNIQTTFDSGSHGNYIREYEVFSTFGDQGYFLKRADNLLPEVISDVLPETTNYFTLVSQESSLGGNFFGGLNNRQHRIEPVDAVPAVMSFIFRENVGGILPSSEPDQSFRIGRADASTVDFFITSDPTYSSGDLHPSGETVVSTNGVSWADLGAEFKTAIEHPTNGFNGNVIVVTAFSIIPPTGRQVSIFVQENTLIGTAGNGGSWTDGTGAGNLIDVTSGFIDGQDAIALVEGNITTTQDRTIGSEHVIRTRFSAPGGPEINSSGYLDVATQQYSVHNSLNYRNLTTRMSGSGEKGRIRLVSHSNRREGLRTLRTRHQAQFGIDSQHGTVSTTDFSAEASFHKQHRNRRSQPKSQTIEVLSPRYDGKNNGIKISTSIGLDPNYSIASNHEFMIMSSWIKLGSNGISTTDKVIFASRVGTTTFSSVFFDQNQNRVLTISSGVWFSKYDLSAIDFTLWSHIVAIAPTSGNSDPSNTFRLFVNGVEQVPTSFITLYSKAGILGDLTLGSIDDGSANNLQGQIALFSYYGRSDNSITSQEISIMAADVEGYEVSSITGFKNFWSLDCSYVYSETDVIADGFVLKDYNRDYEMVVTNSGFYTAELTPFTRLGFVLRDIHDNDNYNSLLPASDFQYSWINSAISGSNWQNSQNILTYAPRNGLISIAEGQVPALTFPGISDLYGE